jgi:aldehyde dehydrogenase (NAD+)
MYNKALEKVVAEGGKILAEGGVLSGEGYESGCYVKPAIAEADNSYEIVQHETFAPVLYLLKYSGEVENAIAVQNGVAQGLSSAIMTNNLREAERFLSVAGSDCGIANVNIGTWVPRLAAHLAVRKKPAADANLVRMPGKSI